MSAIAWVVVVFDPYRAPPSEPSSTVVAVAESMAFHVQLEGQLSKRGCSQPSAAAERSCCWLGDKEDCS